MSAGRAPGSFASVLVGVDGRQGGRDAIALARLLAAPGGKLTLAFVDKDGMFPPTAADEALEADLETPEYEEKRKVLERARAQAGVSAGLAGIVARRVARGLHQLVTMHAADLLVVGSCHRARPERLLLGNDTEEALDDAPCALAVAPRDYAGSSMQLRRLGVGYDESPESERALMAARELSARYHATVRAVEVLEPDGPPSGLGALAWGDALEEELARRKRVMAELPGVNGEVVLGFPREELLRLSGEVDLLVVGSHGYGRFERVTHESISRHLAGHARCSLLVIPPSRQVQTLSPRSDG